MRTLETGGGIGGYSPSYRNLISEQTISQSSSTDRVNMLLAEKWAPDGASSKQGFSQFDSVFPSEFLFRPTKMKLAWNPVGQAWNASFKRGMRTTRLFDYLQRWNWTSHVKAPVERFHHALRQDSRCGELEGENGGQPKVWVNQVKLRGVYSISTQRVGIKQNSCNGEQLCIARRWL